MVDPPNLNVKEMKKFDIVSRKIQDFDPNRHRLLKMNMGNLLCIKKLSLEKSRDRIKSVPAVPPKLVKYPLILY